MESENIKIGFLTYLSRSGSTLLSRLLNEYNDVCVTLEASLPAELFGIKGYEKPVFENRHQLEQYISNLFEFSKLSTWPITKEDLLYEFRNVDYPFSGKYLFEKLLMCYKNNVKPQADIVLFKGSPLMPWYSIELKKSYPDSYVIQIVRDPRAVFASQKNNKQPYAKRNFSSSPTETAYDWKRAVQEFRKSKKNQIIEIKYEELLNDKEKTIKAVFYELGITTIKASSNTFSELIPEEEKSIHKKVSQNPDQSRIDAWKTELNEREIDLMEYFLGSELTKHGYKVTTKKKSSLIPLISKKQLLSVFVRRKFEKIKRIGKYLIKNPAYLFKKFSLRI